MSVPDRAASEQRAFVRDIVLLAGLPLAAVTAIVVWWAPWSMKYEVPEGSDVFAIVEGTWDWTTAEPDSFCVAQRHTISFAPDRSTMTITQSEPWIDDAGAEQQVSVYDVSDHTRRHIRGQIRGEKRLTDSGEPVAWDLVLASRDAYVWRRTDWGALGQTERVERCPSGTPASAAEPNATATSRPES